MKASTCGIVVLTMAFLLAGCGGDEVPEAGVDRIDPGGGVAFAGESLELNTARSSTAERFGPLDERDLDAIGIWFGIPDAHVSGVFSGGADGGIASLHVGSGFEGELDEGIGIGSGRADVEAAFGEAERDPFLSIWWYRSRGVAFELEGDVVSRIHVFPASQ